MPNASNQDLIHSVAMSLRPLLDIFNKSKVEGLRMLADDTTEFLVMRVSAYKPLNAEYKQKFSLDEFLAQETAIYEHSVTPDRKKTEKCAIELDKEQHDTRTHFDSPHLDATNQPDSVFQQELNELSCRRNILFPDPLFVQRVKLLVQYGRRLHESNDIQATGREIRQEIAQCFEDPKLIAVLQTALAACPAGANQDRHISALETALLQARVDANAATEWVAVPAVYTYTARFYDCDRAQLFGLALSGGGIRSATFSLGILQALARLKLLRNVDYLSTVSGGGYIGAWLAAWIKRDGFATVNSSLDPEKKANPLAAERSPIRFLREYSNYLTPRLGFTSGDSWAMVSIYVRNLLLNLAIIVAFLMACLLIPYVSVSVAQEMVVQRAGTGTAFLAVFALVCAVALGVILRSVRGFTCKPVPERAGDVRDAQQQSSLERWLPTAGLIAALLACLLDAVRLWTVRESIIHNLAILDSLGLHFGAPMWVWLGLGVGLLLWVLGWIGGFPDCFVHLLRSKNRAAKFVLAVLILFVVSMVAGLTGGALAWGITSLFRHMHRDLAATVGPPMIILEYFAVTTLFVGLMGKYFPDERREWIGRFAGWLLIFSFGWLFLFGVALYSHFAVRWFASGSPYRIAAGSGITLSWLLTTVASVVAGNSSKTGPEDLEADKSRSPLEWLALIGPSVFLAGLLILLSEIIHQILPRLGHATDRFGHGFAAAILLAICALVAFCLALTVDVNEFSMHHFYRNRLIRCYLGASNPSRDPNVFTGFDSTDDIALMKFAPTKTTCGIRAYTGPYPILNAALNLTAGEQLAWQERKADSFIFTPLFSGFDNGNLEMKLAQKADVPPAYRSTEFYAWPHPGIHLGTAMAISGAAVSPNWGYHSSPAVAFLLTVFNVRLGWWLGNPRLAKFWRRSSPALGIIYLLKELFGLSGADSGYVYLSDGGHFDNFGVYELIRRHCRFIVVCDGEEDHNFTFEGLGNLIRKCRADFGVEIELDIEQLRRKPGEKDSNWHCAVGKIHYENLSKTNATGTIVYLKSSLTGDESPDLLEYSLHNPEFPHQTTADQWFDESQFESYRKLGYHAAMKVFETAIEETKRFNKGDRKEAVFVALQAHWYPPSPNVQKSFTRHTEEWNRLVDTLKGDKHLRFLDQQFYPEWPVYQNFATGESVAEWLNNAWAAVSNSSQVDPFWIPHTREEIRAGFYFCNSLIQLMENVYLDLDLDSQSKHPDNRGWMNLFRHWAWSGMFRVTWATCIGMYGARFQTFCERELRLGDYVIDVSKTGRQSLNLEEQHQFEQLLRDARFNDTDLYQLYCRLSAPVQAISGRPFEFPFGFAVVNRDKKIMYFRIQDHLRDMGFGRRALRELIARDYVEDMFQFNEGNPAPVKVNTPVFERLFESARRIS